MLHKCTRCGGSTEIRTYREFIICPYCKTKDTFPGFEYKHIEWRDSMYAGVKHWMDCPACRSPNAYLGAEGKMWKCPDCGYSISVKDKKKDVFWFRDDCGAFLNVQKGFIIQTGRWICTECRYENDVTEKNII